MEDYRVNLDCYSGPLDLLLYLVRRHEVDLADLPIAGITEQFLEHLRLIQEMDVELAGEFLVMAATLLEIKSAMLMPRPEEAEDTSQTSAMDQGDPRYDLVQQLLAYKRYKDAAIDLQDRMDEWDKRYPVHPLRRLARGDAAPTEDGDGGPVEIDLDDVNVLDLCEAFSRILETIGRGPAMHEVVSDDTPIALHAEDILDRLNRDGKVTLATMFEGRRSRTEMVGVFLAMLELVRQRKVQVLQDEPGGPIDVQLRPEADAAEPDPAAREWRNPETGEVEYEWPSEFEKRRAERRAKLRATRAGRFRGAESGEGADAELDEVIEEEEPADDTP